MRCIIEQNRLNGFNKLNVKEQRDKCEIIFIHEKNIQKKICAWNISVGRRNGVVPEDTSRAEQLSQLHYSDYIICFYGVRPQ